MQNLRGRGFVVVMFGSDVDACIVHMIHATLPESDRYKS